MMVDDNRIKQEIREIRELNGREDPQRLLERIAGLEQECRNSNLNSHDKQKYQHLFTELRNDFRVVRSSRFRFRKGVPDEPEQQDEQAAVVEDQPTQIVNKLITTGSHLTNLSECLVIIDSANSVHISNAQHCTFVVSCHQLRLTECTDCRVFVSCSRPAIEKSTNLVIGYIQGKPQWQGIDDFGWLKSGPNPHYEIGPEINADEVAALENKYLS